MHPNIGWTAGLITLSVFAGVSHAMPVTSATGMVVTAHGGATMAGRDMLRAGGTACDAAVAAAFALAVLEPPCSGIGGGGMALVRADQNSGIEALDFREVAPGAATMDMFWRDGAIDWGLATDSAQAVAVPGAVAGLVALHAACGVLPLAQVLEPAIRGAQEGFEVDLRYHRIANYRAASLRRDPEARRLFLRPDAHGVWGAPPPGAIIVQADLARTLAKIGADRGADFYYGATAGRLSGYLQNQGGRLNATDLSAYQPRWGAPLVGSFRSHPVVTAPLPSRGGMHLLTVLNFLETRDAAATWHSLPWLQRYIMGTKTALADAWLLGDPAFLPQAAARMAILTSKARAQALSATWPVAAPQAMPPPGSGTELTPCSQRTHGTHPLRHASHTTHVSVVDAHGGAVSLTQSLNAYWGAARVVPQTGILLNNQMSDFELAPHSNKPCGMAVNTIAPGKAPLSHMAPTMVLQPAPDAKLRAVLGSPGGRRIPGIIAQAIAALLDDGVDLDVAFALRRIDYDPGANAIETERYALEPQTMQALEEAGYAFAPRIDWGNAAGIAVDPTSGLLYGAADMRGVGLAAKP